MADQQHDGTTIHKYPIELYGRVTTIELPARCRKLAVQVDRGTGLPAMWVELNPDHPKARTCQLEVVVTGGQVPLGEYEGTFQLDDPVGGANFVGHVYSTWL